MGNFGSPDLPTPAMGELKLETHASLQYGHRGTLKLIGQEITAVTPKATERKQPMKSTKNTPVKQGNSKKPVKSPQNSTKPLSSNHEVPSSKKATVNVPG